MVRVGRCYRGRESRAFQFSFNIFNMLLLLLLLLHSDYYWIILLGIWKNAFSKQVNLLESYSLYLTTK
jgi:hypothetical protein